MVLKPGDIVMLTEIYGRYPVGTTGFVVEVNVSSVEPADLVVFRIFLSSKVVTCYDFRLQKLGESECQ